MTIEAGVSPGFTSVLWRPFPARSTSAPSSSQPTGAAAASAATATSIGTRRRTPFATNSTAEWSGAAGSRGRTVRTETARLSENSRRNVAGDAARSPSGARASTSSGSLPRFRTTIEAAAWPASAEAVRTGRGSETRTRAVVFVSPTTTRVGGDQALASPQTFSVRTW